MNRPRRCSPFVSSGVRALVAPVMSLLTSARLVSLAGVVATVTTFAAGCGDLYSDPTEQPGSPQPTAPDFPSATDASASDPRDFVPACSDFAPVEGSTCGAIGSVCEYGSSPDMRCNTTLACAQGAFSSTTWVARPSTLCPSYQCPAKNGDVLTLDGTPCGLPASDAGIASTDAGAPSEADELVCPLSDGVCACTTGVDGAHAHARRWVCVRPDSNCPTTRPLAGAPCSAVRSCDYGSCAFKRGVRMDCTSSSFLWTTGTAVCN